VIFVPRDYQSDIKRFIQETPRCGVFAGMGTGKTASVLMALQELSLIYDVFPALVLAPLRVARSTWPDEVEKWDDITLTISAVIGTADERRAALSVGADVCTTNYENLPWLRQHFGADWPFVTVVADESTKLKSFRLRQGGSRARVLGQVTWPQKKPIVHQTVQRFISLTGTPTPNGVKDLWGQAWYWDRGARLGRSYNAFKGRWFRDSWDGFGIEPLPHAQVEIQSALKDLCITILAGDYFDLPALITNTVMVDLPPKARVLYDQMRRQMYAEIGDGVEAFNAAARTNKCLQIAAGAVYVTDEGEWEMVHDEKLDALEDIIEEAAGMPVLVSYQFQSDLTRILKRFKQARALDHKPQTLKDWNAGKIPLLAAHPGSAGHGLNLQYGSNILCYFTSGWNLEEDMQILERIGPTRQAQSGLNREVYVHRIQARDTVDEEVAESREGKKTVQEILLTAMKRNRQ
jgi:SNF2 family DNA or RNA helicase